MISFKNSTFGDYHDWAAVDLGIFQKISRLIDEIRRDPFRGIGKPEPLRGNLAGYWSRRITEEDRLIYRVYPDQVHIASCKGHY